MINMVAFRMIELPSEVIQSTSPWDSRDLTVLIRYNAGTRQSRQLSRAAETVCAPPGSRGASVKGTPRFPLCGRYAEDGVPFSSLIFDEEFGGPPGAG
jgi:hypothetical protein